jgi:hypothetical protein
MAKIKKSWLDRLEEADRKAQSRLENENKFDTKTAFKKIKARTHKQTDQEKVHKLTIRIYVIFIVQILLLGGLFYSTSGVLDYADALGTSFRLILALVVLTIIMIVMGVFALIEKPKLLFLHLPLLLNCLLAVYAVVKVVTS